MVGLIDVYIALMYNEVFPNLRLVD